MIHEFFAQQKISEFDTANLLLLDAVLIMPMALALFSILHKRATLRLRLVHLLVFCSLMTSPIILQYRYTHILAFSCILATWNLLLVGYPLMASLFFTLALNLDLMLCLPLLPVFLVQAIGKIISSSPSANIVKQVDYIVWKIIFLCLNCMLVCAAIWWPHITTKTSEPDQKLSFDFKPARQILFTHLSQKVLISELGMS